MTRKISSGTVILLAYGKMPYPQTTAAGVRSKVEVHLIFTEIVLSQS